MEEKYDMEIVEALPKVMKSLLGNKITLGGTLTG